MAQAAADHRSSSDNMAQGPAALGPAGRSEHTRYGYVAIEKKTRKKKNKVTIIIFVVVVVLLLLLLFVSCRFTAPRMCSSS